MPVSPVKFRITVRKYSDQEIAQNKIKVQYSTVLPDRPSYEEWCKQLNVSRLHGRADDWLDHLVTTYKLKRDDT